MVLDDEVLRPVESLFSALADVEAEFEAPEVGALTMTEAKLDLPIELGVAVTDLGTVALAGAPPTQHVETAYMPVFHRIRLSIARDEEADGDG